MVTSRFLKPHRKELDTELPRFGSHLSVAGGMYKAAEKAAALGSGGRSEFYSLPIAISREAY